MQITRQANYATRAVLHLSRFADGGSVPTSVVAREQKIPPAFLTKIVARLSDAGIMQTARGRYGGVRLARAPRSITLLEVVEAIDGPIRLNMCVSAAGECPFEPECPMRSVWCDAQDALIAALRSANFAEMMKQARSAG